jgi:hypothetical protein
MAASGRSSEKRLEPRRKRAPAPRTASFAASPDRRVCRWLTRDVGAQNNTPVTHRTTTDARPEPALRALQSALLGRRPSAIATSCSRQETPSPRASPLLACGADDGTRTPRPSTWQRDGLPRLGPLATAQVRSATRLHRLRSLEPLHWSNRWSSEDGAACPPAASPLIGAIPWLPARRPGEWDYEGSMRGEPPGWGA